MKYFAIAVTFPSESVNKLKYLFSYFLVGVPEMAVAQLDGSSESGQDDGDPLGDDCKISHCQVKLFLVTTIQNIIYTLPSVHFCSLSNTLCCALVTRMQPLYIM